ncbi:unnamed protein product, partial [Cuscuta campestris]
RTGGGIFLHQTQFAHEILECADMLHCKPISTPVDTKAKLSATSGTPLLYPSIYRSIVGALQYLTFTRPDLTYAVQQLCLHLHAPRSTHLTAMKRVLRYIHGTATHGITLHRTGTDSLQAYSDADWARCPDTRRSTSGYCVFLGDNLISWSSKRQATTSRSSAEAEYRAVANSVAEASWVRNLLLELQQPLRRATLVFCDNEGNSMPTVFPPQDVPAAVSHLIFLDDEDDVPAAVLSSPSTQISASPHTDESQSTGQSTGPASAHTDEPQTAADVQPVLPDALPVPSSVESVPVMGRGQRQRTPNVRLADYQTYAVKRGASTTIESH